jgi:very-short-patch-repair endonuclease
MFELPMPEAQFVAIQGRKFRFDFAWPAQRVLVEVQEETAHGKWRKQSQDAEKLNLAQLHGYVVLQFTGTMLREDPAGCIKTVTTALAMAPESTT